MGYRRDQHPLHPRRTGIERRPFSNALQGADALAGIQLRCWLAAPRAHLRLRFRATAGAAALVRYRSS